jgi:tetratricopeptide (TPR) repeat protein
MTNTKEISRAEELNNRGIFFIKTEQEQEALKYFNRAIEDNSDYLNSYFNKAIVFKTLQKFDEAIECYNIILRKEPKQGQAYFEKANVLFFYKND